MSTLTDPTSTTTPPSERIDTDPLREQVETKRLSAYFAAEVLVEMLDAGESIDSALHQLRESVIQARAAGQAWSAAIDHNRQRRLNAEQGIAEARQELTNAVARSNGYATADEEAEAAGRDQQHREQDELDAARDGGLVA